MIGKTIRHYEILELLGKGGMGEVYAARDVRLDRSVALKRIRQDVSGESMRKRLWREARAAAAVNHPHVCQIYEVLEEGDDLFIAMELLKGSSLRERMAEGPLAVPEARRITLEVLRALESVHDQGLIHRDLKPANIILTRHGAKLLDFGLSRAQPTGETRADLAITRAGQAVGTPRYMAPEQWVGEGLGPTCDLFAMGAILFEMVTGRPAIVGRTMLEVAEDAIHGRPPSLPEGGAIPNLAPIIRKALARRPEDRYAEARAMIRDLEDDTGGTPPLKASSGTVLCAHTSQATLEDIFQLQDQLSREIVNSMDIPLSPGDRQTLEANRPASGRAYELYLRANQLANNWSRLSDARDLYQSCLDFDPTFAPAWARLGRICRVLAKYSLVGDAEASLARAEEAFRRALDLDPDLSIAHNLYTFHEIEELGRSRESMVRLLERAALAFSDCAAVREPRATSLAVL